MSSDIPLPTSKLTPAEAEAVRWLVRRRAGDMTAQDERAYRVWLERDPAHRAAAAKMERYWKMLGAIGDDPDIMMLTERRARQSNRPVRALRLTALAASIAAAVGLGWMMRGSDIMPDPVAPIRALVSNEPAHDYPPDVVHEQTFRTSVGQRTTVTLDDGSTVTLDTDSLLHTRHTPDERVASLARGRAYFKVSKDAARPFRVTAAGKTVTAVGTEFAVDIEPEKGMTVTLVEGSVRVETPGGFFRRGKTVELKPGWQLVAAADLQAVPVNIERTLSWTSGRLHFFNDSLGSAAQAMNRYSEKQIVIRDPAIRDQPIIGNFRAGDIDAFVRAVRLHGFAEVKLETDDVVELGVPSAG